MLKPRGIEVVGGLKKRRRADAEMDMERRLKLRSVRKRIVIQILRLR